MKKIIYVPVPLKEWQVKNSGQDFNLFPYDHLESGICVLTPVELPTDEEIFDEAIKENDSTTYHDFDTKTYRIAQKNLRNKIFKTKG